MWKLSSSELYEIFLSRAQEKWRTLSETDGKDQFVGLYRLNVADSPGGVYLQTERRWLTEGPVWSSSSMTFPELSTRSASSRRWDSRHLVITQMVSVKLEKQEVNSGFYFVGGSLPQPAAKHSGSLHLLQTWCGICESHTRTRSEDWILDFPPFFDTWLSGDLDSSRVTWPGCFIDAHSDWRLSRYSIGGSTRTDLLNLI